nr:terminase small subunit [Pseudomonas aeruginosa]
MALTDKQRRFVDAKARGASNKAAAEAAGYAPSSSAAAGARLAKHPEIIAALKMLKGRRDVKPRSLRRSRARTMKRRSAMSRNLMASTWIACRLRRTRWSGWST